MKRLTHDRIWSAIDALAHRYGLSASGLAKRSGLDPTAFNKSKRSTGEGRPRWPTTESIAKVLDATGATLADFTTLASAGLDTSLQPQLIPLIGMTQAGTGEFFDNGGYPVGGGWEQMPVPRVEDENAYALRVTSESMEPLYREGDVLIVSPNASTHSGDRVVIRTTDGEVLATLLVRRTAKTIELTSMNPDYPKLVFPLDRVEWIARIIWVSQ